MRNERQKRIRTWCPYCDYTLTVNYRRGRCRYCNKKFSLLEARQNVKNKILKEVENE